MTFRRQLPLLGLLFSLGCSDATGPGLQGVLLNGTWTHDAVAAYTFHMSLSAHGNVVSGSGTWWGEPCCAGSVFVSGVVAHGVVKLDMTLFDYEGNGPGPREHFEGRVVGFNALSGTLTTNGQSAQITYQKMH